MLGLAGSPQGWDCTWVAYVHQFLHRDSPDADIGILEGANQQLLAATRQTPDLPVKFVSLAFGQKARDAGIAVSMGSKGDCFDNAVAESFFATLKKELVHRRSWPTRRELTSEVFEYVEAFYNATRRHSTLGHLSPAQFRDRINDQ